MSNLQDTGFWSRFKSAFARRSTALKKGDTSKPISNISTGSGANVNSDTALKIATVWACVRLRSQTIASLPLNLRDKNKDNVLDHEVYKIISVSPNADMTPCEFWEAMSAGIDLWGNAYAKINRLNKRIISLDVLNPERMSVKRSKSGLITYIYDDKFDGREYADDEIFHLKGFSLDGLVGLSTIKYAALTMGQQISANDAAQHEFKNNLKVGGFLKTGEKVLSDEQRKGLRESLETFSAPKNAGKIMVLEAGMDVSGGNQIRMNPQDAQLLESRAFGIEEICRAFNVPPQLIYHTNKTSSWASSLEQINMAFLTYSLRPTLVRIEQAISKNLLSTSDRLKLKAKFNIKGLLRADSQGRAEYYSTMLQNGVMTRNEVRALEDLPPLPHGNELTVQLNMTTLQNVGKENVKTE